MPNPDVRGRQEILELYLQDKPLSEDVDVKTLARGTPGFNGAGGLWLNKFNESCISVNLIPIHFQIPAANILNCGSFN